MRRPCRVPPFPCRASPADGPGPHPPASRLCSRAALPDPTAAARRVAIAPGARALEHAAGGRGRSPARTGRRGPPALPDPSPRLESTTPVAVACTNHWLSSPGETKTAATASSRGQAMHASSLLFTGSLFSAQGAVARPCVQVLCRLTGDARVNRAVPCRAGQTFNFISSIISACANEKKIN